MNQEDVIKMAREAELSIDQFGAWLAMREDLERFAALVAAKASQDEREACEQAMRDSQAAHKASADIEDDDWDHIDWCNTAALVYERAADQIKARGQ